MARRRRFSGSSAGHRARAQEAFDRAGELVMRLQDQKAQGWRCNPGEVQGFLEAQARATEAVVQTREALGDRAAATGAEAIESELTRLAEDWSLTCVRPTRSEPAPTSFRRPVRYGPLNGFGLDD